MTCAIVCGLRLSVTPRGPPTRIDDWEITFRSAEAFERSGFSVVIEAARFRPRRLSMLYTLRKMLLPEPASGAQCTAAVPTELARAKWSIIVEPLNNSIVFPFAIMAEVMLLGCVSARSRTLVGVPVVLTFIL